MAQSSKIAADVSERKKTDGHRSGRLPSPQGGDGLWGEGGGGSRQCADEVSATRLGLGASHTARAASEKDTAAIMKM